MIAGSTTDRRWHFPQYSTRRLASHCSFIFFFRRVSAVRAGHVSIDSSLYLCQCCHSLFQRPRLEHFHALSAWHMPPAHAHHSTSGARRLPRHSACPRRCAACASNSISVLGLHCRHSLSLPSSSSSSSTGFSECVCLYGHYASSTLWLT